MEVLWTPWRMSYIKSVVERKKGGCLFCEVQNMDDEEVLILYRGKKVFIMLNAFPYNTAHVMIAPYRHIGSIEEMNDEELMETMRVTKMIMKVIRNEYAPDGFNVGWNIGSAAGAGIPGHVHLHVVPRWVGDSNFMTVIGDVKVLPEALSDTYKRLKRGLRRLQ